MPLAGRESSVCRSPDGACAAPESLHKLCYAQLFTRLSIKCACNLVLVNACVSKTLVSYLLIYTSPKCTLGARGKKRGIPWRGRLGATEQTRATWYYFVTLPPPIVPKSVAFAPASVLASEPMSMSNSGCSSSIR